ncbi:hypothetical protein Taro_007816, partial [Colocasia esculenta]|nr:hypothetical protein [Colocasia esculenta]
RFEGRWAVHRRILQDIGGVTTRGGKAPGGSSIGHSRVGGAPPRWGPLGARDPRWGLHRWPRPLVGPPPVAAALVWAPPSATVRVEPPLGASRPMGLPPANLRKSRWGSHRVNKEILTTLPEEDPEGSLRESTWISLDRLNRAGIDRSRFDSSDPTQILLSWVDPAGNVGFWGASRGNRSLGGRSDPGSSDSGSIPAILPSMAGGSGYRVLFGIHIHGRYRKGMIVLDHEKIHGFGVASLKFNIARRCKEVTRAPLHVQMT